jgi:hypothetical protein
MPQDPACGAALRSGAVLVAAQRVAPGGPTAGSRSAYVSRSSKAADKQGDAGRLLARIQYLEAKVGAVYKTRSKQHHTASMPVHTMHVVVQ